MDTKTSGKGAGLMRSGRGRGAVALLAAAAAVVTAAVFAAPASAHAESSATVQSGTDVHVGAQAQGGAPLPGGAQVRDRVAPSSSDRHVDATIRGTSGIGFGDLWYRATDSWSGAGIPPASVPSGHAVFGVTGYGPGLVMAYQIYAGSKPTGFWVGATFYSPDMGSNSARCWIYDGNPTLDGTKQTVLSPYSCSWSNIRGNNPKPTLTVSVGTVVTDKAQARDLLAKYCTTGTAAKDCRYLDSDYTSSVLGESHMVGQLVRNNGSTAARHDVGWDDQTSASNTIGVSLTNSAELWGVWTTSLELKYDHTWQTSHSFHETTSVEVPAHAVSWIEFAPNMQAVEGAWVINAGSTRYVIPEVGLKAPLPNGGTITVNTCPQSFYSNGKCSVPTTVLSTQQQ